MSKRVLKAPAGHGAGKKVARHQSNPYVEATPQIPAGEVVTFGELALMAVGECNMGTMIQAGRAVKGIPSKSRQQPWWRVVSAGKKTLLKALQPEREAEQRKRLAADGIDLSQQLARNPLRLPRFLVPSLGTKVILPRGRHTHTFIYLHGKAHTGLFYQKRAHFFEASRAWGLRVVLPTAPLGKLPTAWYAGRPATAERLVSPRERVQSIIVEELRRLGGRSERLLLGGTSQGCMVGVDSFVRFPEALGGFCGLVGYWPEGNDAALRRPIDHRRKRPLRFFNGLEDEIVRWDYARPTFEKLQTAGFSNLRVTTGPHVGHSMGEQEGRWIRAFLEEVL